MRRRPLPCDPRRHARGSAYVLTLLALVVLTILGLGVSLITQTEMLVGANERTVQRLFYAADAGVATATARVLVEADYGAKTLPLADLGKSGDAGLRSDVEMSPFMPILISTCNLCEVNNLGQYGTKAYENVNHAVTVTARRRAGSDTTSRGEKTLSAMIEIQPWQTPPEALLPLTDSADLALIKF
jgi:Tfp pilus assembly protein PilX